MSTAPPRKGAWFYTELEIYKVNGYMTEKKVIMNIVIGIAGGSGSGKTTICDMIADKFTDSVSVLHFDDYYKGYDEKTFEEKTRMNFDHPNTLDMSLFAEHLSELKQGHSIEAPVYNFVTYERMPETREILSNKVIIAEGIYTLLDERIRNLCDVKLFVDADSDIRVLRKIDRDVRERGRSLDFSTKQYLCMTKPMHDAFVEPTKRYADIIIPNNKDGVVMDMIFGYIRDLIG